MPRARWSAIKNALIPLIHLLGIGVALEEQSATHTVMNDCQNWVETTLAAISPRGARQYA